jgi:choline dehydrogenase-like flavoprotein
MSSGLDPTMADADYIIIGSGAGGGPLAANLAREGFKVLLLEAGGDLMETDDVGRLHYAVPVFHGLCSEDERCSWNFFVHHYANRERETRDRKYCEAEGGVWYPRTGSLGGCTVHNAMITVTPQALDWNTIAHLTGDPTWRAENMYKYFTRLERCGYVSRPWTLGYFLNGLVWSAGALLSGSRNWTDWTSGHGFGGWLPTNRPSVWLVLKDWVILRILINVLRISDRWGIGNIFTRLIRGLDVNDIRNSADGPEGLALATLTTKDGRRQGPREFLRQTAREKPDNLKIVLNTLVTKIVFDGKRAVGVDALQGDALYEASPCYSAARKGEPVQFTAGREVIVAAGAFNSPQLLKLSGIGPRQELEALGIPVIVDLPGVGENLQDRYEVAVVSEFEKPFALLHPEATFAPPVDAHAPTDPLLEEWVQGRGLYCSTGSLIAIMKRSSPDLAEPDLFIFGLPGYFRGYEPGYSKVFERFRNKFTWIILKAYTSNTMGRVTLTGGEATKRPRVDFHYFDEGSDEGERDLRALLNGVKLVRELNARLGKSIVREEEPGPSYLNDQDVMEFIKNEAWGHHASCTNKIGPKSDPMAVLDSRFRVRGTERLRVVDASVFPKIPGHFIVSAIYMISEKAFDVIKEDAAGGPGYPAEAPITVGASPPPPHASRPVAAASGP